jgi:hypothetical protein
LFFVGHTPVGEINVKRRFEVLGFGQVPLTNDVRGCGRTRLHTTKNLPRTHMG